MSKKPVFVVEPDTAQSSKNGSKHCLLRKDNTHHTEDRAFRLSTLERKVEDDDSKLAPAPIVPTPPKAKPKRKNKAPTTSVSGSDSEWSKPPSPKKPRRSSSDDEKDPEHGGHPPNPQIRPATENGSISSHATVNSTRRRISREQERKVRARSNNQAGRGELGEEKSDSVRGSGFDRESELFESWMTMYKRLVAYEKAYGNTRVSRNYKKDIQLANWVFRQRSYCKKKDRIDLLNAIGFEWHLVKERSVWMEMYRRLVAYKNIHGDTRVPVKYKEDPKLGRWVKYQRNCCKDEFHIDLLNEIEFEWQSSVERNQVVWMEMYRRLVAYKQIHGDTKVPVQYDEDPKLGRWVACQRHSCKDEFRIDLLNALGFKWKSPERKSNREVWMEMYGRLVAYKEEHGDTRVPCAYEEDTRLANWVTTQRQCCKNQDRIDLLNAIGFLWDARSLII
jgi:hypothetical protein